MPAIAIKVYGPPPTSGTRDSFNELILDKGCNANPAMAALKRTDEARHQDICTKVREDGAFVETGENDNLIVQKLIGSPDTVGVFGYSFLEENGDKLRGVALDGVEPSSETISNFTYPGARPCSFTSSTRISTLSPASRSLWPNMPAAGSRVGICRAGALFPRRAMFARKTQLSPGI